MKRIALLFTLLSAPQGVLAACTGSSPTWTSTADYASVNTCFSSSSRGDTINVAAGSVTWANTLTLTHGISLIGAGVGNTVITDGTTKIISGQPDATAIANDEKITITGFTFDGNSTQDTLLELEGASGISGTKAYCCYVIGNNKFQNTTTTSGQGVIQSQANANGQLRGVIYSNTFDRCDTIMRGFSNNDTREWGNTAFNQLAFGTSDTLYFESNTIQFSSAYAGANPGYIEIGQGFRISIRYNTWNLANATNPAEVWDIHGFQNWSGVVDSGQTSTMIEENYGNTFTNMGTFRLVDHRGSWGLYFNNILTGAGGNAIQLYGMSTPGSCSSDINPTPTNYTPQVNNTYFFNNTVNGLSQPATMDGGNPIHCSVTENSNWWNLNAGCTTSACSTGVGTATTAPTGTCTTGVGFWVASTPGATVSSAVIQNGKLYKCTSTNTWTLYYTPYTYPHPLISGNGQVGTPNFSPATGTYSSTQNVSLSTSTSGSTICYTIDGSTPTANGAGTCTHGTTFTTPIAVALSTTINAIGSHTGNLDSAVGSAAYTIQPPPKPIAPSAVFTRLSRERVWDCAR